MPPRAFVRKDSGTSDDGMKQARWISVASRYFIVVYEPKRKAQGDVAAREPVT